MNASNKTQFDLYKLFCKLHGLKPCYATSLDKYKAYKKRLKGGESVGSN